MVRIHASPLVIAIAVVGCADDGSPSLPQPNPCPLTITQRVMSPPAPDARTDRELATDLDFVSTMVVDATHVYLALSTTPPYRLVRIPKDGGPTEELASVGFAIRSLSRMGDSMLIAGPDFTVHPTHSTIAAVDLQPPHAVRVIAEADKLISSVVVRDAGIDAIVDRGPEHGRPDDQLFRVEGDRLVAVKRRPIPAKLSHYPLAFDASYLYVVDDEGSGLFALGAARDDIWWIRWDKTDILGVAAGGQRVYVRTADDQIVVVDPATRKTTEIEDLKGPALAATDAGAVIATRGDIAHIPDYRGAVLWFDPATATTRVILDRFARPVAADADFAYGVVDDALIKIPLR